MKKKTSLLLLGSSLALSFLISLGGTKTLGALEATNYDNLKVLLENYYNDGEYKKDSRIYVDTATITEDLASYFHAKSSSIKRTTYYQNDALWMSRGNGSYSYYGTSYDAENNPNGVTNASATVALETPESAGIALEGEYKNSMEEYYCTLKDFIDGSHISAHTDNVKLDFTNDWEYSNGVYSSTNADIIDGFRLFTAPLWLGKTAENENYLKYDRVTVQEVESKLIMRLYADSTESGKLTTTDGLFSQAVISNKTLGENLQEYSLNLQEGLGTDFEGYSPDNPNNANLFDPNATVSAGSQGTWYADSNGVEAYAHQSGYKIRLIEEEDGNVALRVGGYTRKNLFRVGVNLTEEVCEPGTYVAKIRIKRGPEANIPNFFFKINNGSRTDSNVPLQYAKDGDADSVTGFYFNNTASSDPNLNFEFDTEWNEYSTTFTIEEGSAVDNATSVCAAFVMYTSNSETNYTKDYLLIDDFEIYRVESQGTNFEGFNKEEHASLYPDINTTVSNGWKTDSNGVKAIGIQKNYQGVTLATDPENENNTVVRVRGSQDLTRFAMNVNQEIVKTGDYKASIKVKLGTTEATSIGKILIRINKRSDVTANGALTESIYLSDNTDTDSILSVNEWTTLDTKFTITEELSKKLSAQEVCIAFIVYTYNKTNELDNTKNHILVDDFELRKYTY